MHERKVQMALRSAGFVGLPGGFGTFEEVINVFSSAHSIRIPTLLVTCLQGIRSHHLDTAWNPRQA